MFPYGGVIAGQLPQNIALRLKQNQVNVLGTDPEKIDSAEDRHKFSSILDSIGVDQPEWTEVSSVNAAKEFANKVGYVIFILTHVEPRRTSLPATLSLFARHMCSPVPP